ncbi:MAG: iron-sulfur cluster-binding domain-containing protein [Deltaproteobacteria bacterium]|nr:iron-sulfur cluster-binding domain-containing protein [Deltaproteobacteria bacterium]
MKKAIFEDFDGYQDIVEEIEFSRKFGVNYTKARDMPAAYIDRLHPARLELRVSDMREEGRSAGTFRLVPVEGHLPPFLAGQYISLSVETKGIRTSRPYSLSSPPNQTGFWEITVQRVASGLVSGYLLDHVKRGDLIESSGPCGTFYYNPVFHDREMVMIAGGAGITPFMSMIREITQRGLDREVYLFYGNRTLEGALFHQELRALSERFDTIQYVPVIEAPPEDYRGAAGLITGELIRETAGEMGNKTFYLCGPQGLYDFCIPELKALGIPGRKIRREVYGPPLDITTAPGWPEDVRPDQTVSISVRGEEPVPARSGEPLLKALETAGLKVRAICRSGECSMCRVRVVSGTVFQPPGVPVRKSDRRFGYVHSCVSYPLEDLEIEM